MRREASQISVCLDSNVIISAIAFGGKPLEVLHRALCREFYLVIGPNIISEVSRNLVQKLALDRKQVQRVLDDILAVASSLKSRVTADLASIKNRPALVRSFFKAPSVAYTTD